MFCKYCGSKLRDDAVFCTNCGKKITAVKVEEKPEVQEKQKAKETVGKEIQESKPTVKSEAQKGESGAKNTKKWIPFIILGAVIVILLVVVIVLAVGKKKTPMEDETDKVAFTEDIEKKDDDESVESSEQGEEQQETEDDTTKDESNTDELVTDEEENSQPEEPTETKKPAEDSIHRYEIIIDDVTWYEAHRDCVKRGGYLVNINSPEEYEAILAQIEEEGKTGITFWLGATLVESEYYWMDEIFSTPAGSLPLSASIYEDYWLAGEPSYYSTDAEGNELEECYIDMFYRKSEGRYYWNDAPNDIIAVVGSYAGNVGYICEYED